LKGIHPAIFASQYLNYPIAASQQVLPEHLLLSAVIARDDAPALSSNLFIDLASEGENPDDSVCIAGKQDQVGRMYMVDAVGDKWPVASLAVAVINMILKHRPLKVMIEKTASAIYFVAYLQTVCKDKGIQIPTIEYIKVDNKPDAKNKRVESLAGHVKNKRFFFFAGLPAWEKFVEQAKQFPKGKHGHDDWPDTAGLMAQVLSVKYIGAMTHRPVSKNPMIDLLARDPVMQGIDNMGQEYGVVYGDCGSEFSC
jgi:predicted phage terminase large subunit-like protein